MDFCVANTSATDLSALSRILFARDERRMKVEELYIQFRTPVLVLTLNIPGSQKIPSWAADLLRAGQYAINDRFLGYKVLHDVERIAGAGWEWYAVIDVEPWSMKSICIDIEEEHPLGRLFDIDVHTREGILSRSQLGAQPRRCLICENDARICSRRAAHSLTEILEREQSMVAAYLKTSSPLQRPGRLHRGGDPIPRRLPL